MSELNELQREALLASANKHEDASKTVRGVIDYLAAHGYTVYGDKLREVITQMISHVDTARDLERRK